MGVINGPATKPSVLIAEDSMTQTALYSALMGSRYQLHISDTYRSSLELISSGIKFDAALCDWQLPDGDGIALLEELAKVSPNCAATLITAYPKIEMVQSVLNRNLAFRFLQKGSDLSEVEKAVRECIAQTEARRRRTKLEDVGVPNFITSMLRNLFTQVPAIGTYSGRLIALGDMAVKDMPSASARDFELAARLAYVGFLGVPYATLDKLVSGIPVSDEEWAVYATHSTVAYQMISGVPRLSGAGQLILDAFDSAGRTYLEAHLLKILHDSVWMERRFGLEVAQATLSEEKTRTTDSTHRAALSLGLKVLSPQTDRIVLRKGNAALMPGDLLAEDVLSNTGTLLLMRGSKLTAQSIRKIYDLNAAEKLSKPVEIYRKLSHVA